VEGEEEAEAAMTAVRWLGRVVALGLVVVGLAAPVGASAAITCEYQGSTGIVFVQMGADGDSVRLGAASGNVRVVNRATSAIVDCPGGGGPPTTTNTESVIVNDNSASGSITVEVSPMTDFSPGESQENGSDAFSEIEMNVNYGGGPNDRFISLGTEGADGWRLGQSAINWNAASGDPSPDADITLSPAPDKIDLWGQAGDDTISSRGGLGTGGVFAAATNLILQGFAGDDTIEGGDSDYLGLGVGDSLTGGAGDDTIRGFAQNDLILAGPDDDTVDGGAGDLDALDLSAAPGGVTVDLGRSGPQPTGQGTDTVAGIEQVAGTTAGDTLIGDAKPNHLFGDIGDDTIDGRGGADTLGGGDDVDTVTYERAPAGVTADLRGAPFGTASGGGGNDLLGGFENLIGSPFADDLTGDDLANSITGLGGTDTVKALAGPDAVDVRDGRADTASCGSEIDTATADQEGVDAVNADCENVSFLPPAEGNTPSNDFSFGKARKNKKKGTAKLTVNVPGAGELELAKSKKVKNDEERATAEGGVKLLVKPKGKARQKLGNNGKAKVKAEVTYTPDGGDPNTKSKRVKLARRR